MINKSRFTLGESGQQKYISTIRVGINCESCYFSFIKFVLYENEFAPWSKESELKTGSL